MLKQLSGRWTRIDLPTIARPSQAIIGVGLTLIVANTLFRGWALFNSWFYLDDYNLLLEATSRRLDAQYLLDPYNSHLMPGGRLLAWWVAQSGQLNWKLAAGFIVALQLAAALSALWMLVTLFGVRWAALVPLVLYLTSSMTVPAMMWWTAAVNQVPLQVSFFLATGSWVAYLRGRQMRWLLATLAAVVLGLFFYVKALLIFPLLAFLMIGYFTSGRPRQRLTAVLSRYWRALALGGVVVVTYVGYYRSHVTQPFTEVTPTLVGQVADTMLGTALPVGLTGGPWRWSALAPPNSFAAPPDWAVHASWVMIVLLVIYGVLTRHRSFRAWVLLAGYVVGLMSLLVTSRAASFGGLLGLEYRYLTDASAAFALSLGLAFLPLKGAQESSRRRTKPLIQIRFPRWGVAMLVLLVCVSSMISTLRYVRTWHTGNASDAYVHTLATDLRIHGSVDLADQSVPDNVIAAIFAPDNAVSRLAPLVSNNVSFPDHTDRLAVVASDGTLRSALIGPGVISEEGPREDCGWRVRSRGRTIPLTGRAFEWEWWVRIGYLGSQESDVVVSAGTSRVETTVQAGLNSLYVRVEGGFDSVRIDGLAPGVTLCVDTVEVGQPVPGGRLS